MALTQAATHETLLATRSLTNEPCLDLTDMRTTVSVETQENVQAILQVI